MEFLSAFDFILLPFYLAIIGFIAYRIQQKNIEQHSEYKYFIKALYVKIFGAIALCLIYTLYYKEGGDTTGYFLSSKAVGNVFFKNPKAFLSIMLNQRTADIHSNFTQETGYPWYWYDSHAFSVVRFTSLFIFLGGFKYILTSVLVACATFTGTWRLYLTFCEYIPKRQKELAWAVLFVPSVVFWGSGIMKDSFLLAAIGWLLYSVNKIITTRKYLRYGFTILVSLYILMAIKPFILYGIGVGLSLWLLFSTMYNIKNQILRIICYPLVIIVVGGIGIGIFGFVSSLAGGYYGSVNTMLERAVIIQDDLTRDYYGENSFDIGKFNPTLPGIASKFPVATIAGLFRPFLWESRSVVMLLSGLENTILLLLTLYIIFRTGPGFVLKTLFSKPYFISFSIMFAVFFAFSVGLVTANFGALVRYKIPVIPFYLAALIAVYDKFQQRKIN